MDNQEQDSKRERRFKYAQAVHQKMEEEAKKKKEIERKRREEEKAREITQPGINEINNKIRRRPIQIDDNPKVSFGQVLDGLLYGFIVGAVGTALVVFLVFWASAGFPNIEVWLDGEGAVIAVVVLGIAGLIGGAIGAVTGLVIVTISS